MAKRPQYFNTGTIFYNEKEKDTHPDMKGLVDVEGNLYWVTAWWKKTKSGDDFQSISLQEVTDEQLEKYFKDQPIPEGYYESKSKDRPAGKPGGPRQQGDHRNKYEPDQPATPRGDRYADQGFDDLEDDLPF